MVIDLKEKAISRTSKLGVVTKLAITINKDNQHELESKCSQLKHKYST